MFAKLKEKLAGGAQRLAGRTDLLEAVCASCALVAAADGTIEDSEVAQIGQSLSNHPVLSAAFSPREIEAVIYKMLARAQGGRACRAGLYKEIEEAKAKSTADDLEMIVLVALDVADADGDLGDDEKAVVEKIGKTLGVSTAALMEV